MQALTAPIKAFLATNPQEEALQPFLRSYNLPDLKPSAILHQTDLSKQSEPAIFYTRLMVQDILENQYYYPLIVKKPIQEDSEFHFLKFGCQDATQEYGQQIFQLSRDPDYVKPLLQREVLVCCSIRHESPWLKALKGQNKQQEISKITVYADGKKNYKLGQVFDAVCYYEPKSEALYILREVSKQEAIEANLDPWTKLLESEKNEIVLQTRKTLLNLFSKFSSDRYSQFLLYSLLSDQSLFLSGDNFQPILSQLLPQICHLTLKAPFRDSLFPYKNSEGCLISTQMQTTSQTQTYFILDFSELSQNQQVKITQQEIDNLRALKVFVEDANTIYRWEIGESLVKHSHSGLVVKGSNIVVPHFHLKQEKFPLEAKELENLIKSLSEEEIMAARIYIAKARALKPTLKEADRTKIEQDLKNSNKIPKDQFNLKEIMRIAKLNAMSSGRQDMLYEDYVKGKELVFAEFL